MNCPININTIRNGIQNKAINMLTESGQFEKVDQFSVKVIDTESDYGKTISNVNNAFGEQVVKKLQFQLNNKESLQPQIEELDRYLLNYLKEFGVQSKEFEDLKSRIGVDALEATDVLNKLIWYTKNRNEETVPEEVGHMIVMLMGKNNPIMKDLLKEITNWSEYESVKEQYLPIYKSEEQVKIEAIGKILAKSLVKNYKASGLNQSLLEKALSYISKLIEDITSLFSAYNYSEYLADKISINILLDRKDFIKQLDNSYFEINKQVDYKKSLENNPLAKDIIKNFSEDLENPLVGSLAIAAQNEDIFRPGNEPIHDLDFIVDGRDKSKLEKLEERLQEYNAVPVHYGWSHSSDGYTTYAYYIPKKGYSINVLEREKNWAKKIEVRNEKGEIVPNNSENVIAVDFFIYEIDPKRRNIKNFNSWNDIFYGKLMLSPKGKNEVLFDREKDQRDYLLINPKNRNFISNPAFVYYQMNESTGKEELQYTIEPSDNLVNTYLEAAPVQEQSSTAPIKEGVPELFESNPELANAVYTALGFKRLMPMSSGYIDTTKVKKIGDLLNLNSSPLVKLLMSIEGIKDIKIESLEGQLDKNGNQEERPFYDTDKKTIFMYHEKESTILHEIIHAVTSNYLKDNETSKFHLQLKALYQDYNNHITKNNLERPYALTNLSEFIAEGLSNPKIIEQLKTIQYTNNKSIFEKLVDIVKEFFGTISQENLYDNLLRGFGEYLTENFNLNNIEQQALQLYSQYLDTVFPDSKVKDIVYHHSDTKITEFKKEFPEGYAAKKGVSPRAKFFLRKPLKEEFLSRRSYLGQYLINTINPNVMPVNADRSEKRDSGIKEGIQEALDNGQDGAIFDNIWDNQTWSDVLVVFEPEQIHILGSKQDIEGFKEFINKEDSAINSKAAAIAAMNDYFADTYSQINISEQDLYRIFQENNITYKTENGKPIFIVNNSTIKDVSPKLLAAQITLLDSPLFSIQEKIIEEFNNNETKKVKLFKHKSLKKSYNKDLDIETFIGNEKDIKIIKDIVDIFNKKNESNYYPVFEEVDGGYNVQIIKTPSDSIIIEGFINQLQKTFPDVKVHIISELELEEYLPEGTDMNSFAIGTNVYLIQERLTPDITVEELLHPFVAGLFEQNRELFDNLFTQAKKENPSLYEEINKLYSISYSKEDVEKEFLTRVLQREYMNKNYSSSIISQFLKWLSDVFSKLSNGKLYIKDIAKNATIKDITLLLRSGIPINLGNIESTTIFANLKQSDKEIIDRVLSRANPEQISTVKQIIDSSPVIFNEVGHQYLDKTDPSIIYESTTTKIKGPLKSNDYEINRTVGTQIDLISQAVITGVSLEEVIKNKQLVPNLSEKVIDAFYKSFSGIISELTSDGSIVVPQLRIGDKESRLAGSPDLVLISPDGRVQGIIDLKTSKNSIGYIGHTRNLWDSALENPTDGSIISLSTKEQHSLQVQAYATILENSGIPVGRNYKTLHYKVNIVNNIASSIFLDNPKDYPGGVISHNAFVLRPSNPQDKNSQHFNVLNLIIEKKVFEEREVENAEIIDINDMAIVTKKMISRMNERIEVLQNRFSLLISSKSLAHKSLKEYLGKLGQVKELAQLYYDSGMIEESYDSILNFINTTFEKRIEGLISLQNKTITKEVIEGISYLIKESDSDLSMAKAIRDESSFTKSTNVIKQIDRLNKNISSFSEMADNFFTDEYIKYWAKDSSKIEITDDDITEIISQNYDITDASYYLRDLATSNSKILALLDRTYKRKMFEIDERLLELSIKFSSLGNEVMRTHSGDKSTAYHFMLKKDKDGKISGNYVRKDGVDYQKYWEIWKKYHEPLMNPNATSEEERWLTYIDNPQTPEDLDYNISLYNKKQYRREFLDAEVINYDPETDESEVMDGMYHRYSAEFKRERDKYEVLVRWSWQKRDDISMEEYTKFRNKYYEPEREITTIERVDGDLTGYPVKKMVSFVKNDYVEKRQITSKGESMVDPQYKEIMSWMNEPEGSEKKAKYNFFMAYTEEYESGMLAKLPEEYRKKMVGKVARIKSSALADANLKLKGNIFNKFIQSLKEFFSFKAEDVSVFVDEEGFEDRRRLPIYFTGDFQNVKNIENLQKKIQELKDNFKDKKISVERFSSELQKLNNLLNIEKGRITKGQLETDLTKNILQFARMSEYYFKMQEMETTLFAIEKIILNTKYKKRNNISEYLRKKGDFEEAAFVNPAESYTYKRFNDWKDMVFYRNINPYKPKYAQVIRKFMQMMSLRSVGLNAFGQMNNYFIGRIANAIERNRIYSKHLPLYYDRESFNKATKEYNIFAASFRKNPETGYYKIGKSAYKYEAVMKYFNAIRANQTSLNIDDKGFYETAQSLGYVMMEKVEFALQSKTAASIIMSTYLTHNLTGEKISLYDALEFDSKTGDISVKDGYELTEDLKFNIRNLIWEVNKSIHGNYAYEDRMVIQKHLLGDIASQFRKYIVPAIDARFRNRYFNEERGWTEGRYLSYVKMYRFIKSGKMNVLEAFNALDEVGKINMMKNIHEALIFFTILIAYYGFSALGKGADDDDERKFYNMLSFQADRLKTDIMVYWPIIGTFSQYQVIKNPAAILTYAVDYFQIVDSAAKTLMGEGVYKSGNRKGDYKLIKEINDVLPVVQQFNKWENFDTIKEFYIR